MNNPENYIMPYGKYEGYSLREINELDTSYLEWIYDNFEDKNDKSEEIRLAVEGYLSL